MIGRNNLANECWTRLQTNMSDTWTKLNWVKWSWDDESLAKQLNNNLSIWVFFLLSLFLFSLCSSAPLYFLLHSASFRSQCMYLFIFSRVFTALLIIAGAVISLSGFYFEANLLVTLRQQSKWTTRCHAHPHCCSDPGDSRSSHHLPLVGWDNLGSWGDGERSAVRQ